MMQRFRDVLAMVFGGNNRRSFDCGIHVETVSAFAQDDTSTISAGRCRAIVLACMGYTLLVPTLAAETPETTGGGSALNITVSTRGDVAIKRHGWMGYAPVVFGTNLQLGDLLKVGDSSSVKVVCSDLKMHDIAAGIAGVPCPPSLAVLRAADGSRINVTRSYGTSITVLAPRKTKVLSGFPMLRWTPVEGAKSYTVIVRADHFFWSERVGAVTQMEYPQDAPKLKPGVDYKVIVHTEDKSSEDEAGLGLGFAVLDTKEKKRVEDEQKVVEGLGLPEGPTQFLLAQLYSAHDLRSEAIEKLEKVSISFKVAAVARSLGDFYLDEGLMRDAERDYLSSLAMSTPENDGEGQMRSHLALANIYRQGLGNRKLASEHLEAALALAKKIGDDSVVAEAGKEYVELKVASGP